ncbi:MAG: phytanoyl-CoA dioxygenase [Gammaproteobacteria bacterium]|jgi:ectoine hydroxylase-related dioxygenase (phytanoyl-CoA dioxygenase family)|nr:phytanoyl-CoA dioxygenase [Gammaproteobacteria bacterium]MBT5203822.1 phytanoyl-CoA dioxygenase [Gammaproteobacteria bacterium]MBT5603140.1 phytanoyl-CoA dioxygenase [Gammaproteobacteria bacterium]MBT6245964.1 phytanoyl-CoA dioxygenase [Gammaproteobacteria bacterium]
MNLAESFQREGVVFQSQVLDNDAMTFARKAYEWSLTNPGKGATRLIPGTPGTFYGDLANPRCFDAYSDVNTRTVIPQLVTALWGKPDIWFMYEQIFKKTGGSHGRPARRTPWHQDLPYLPVEGNDLAVVWISFEPLNKNESLELVRGSHLRTLYDGSKFDPRDDTEPLYGTGELPRLPDIEKNRKDYDIVSFAIEPGDVVIFHPKMLHGGAPTSSGNTRCTLSLRYFGDDARVAWRPNDTMERIAKVGSGAEVHPMTRAKQQGIGAPFRDEGFPKLT